MRNVLLRAAEMRPAPRKQRCANCRTVLEVRAYYGPHPSLPLCTECAALASLLTASEWRRKERLHA